MFDALEWGSLWEWCAPDPEVVTYQSRNGPDAYVPYTLQAIRTGTFRKGETDLGSVIAPSTNLDFLVWQDWLTAVGMPDPKLDDYLTDAAGVGWTVIGVEWKLRQQVFVLKTTNRD